MSNISHVLFSLVICYFLVEASIVAEPVYIPTNSVLFSSFSISLMASRVQIFLEITSILLINIIILLIIIIFSFY